MATDTDPDPRRQFLVDIFKAAVAVARPEICLARRLPPPPRGRLIVTGAGKAAAAMAQVVEAHYGGRVSGAVVTRHGYGLPTRSIEVLEAGHPIPDEASELAAERMLALARSAGADDLVLFLLSGGGSALMAAPAAGLSLADKIELNRALLRSGATISEINCVRKKLSRIKGGRLAAEAYPAPIVTLAISDVPGDDPSLIASGPTVTDSSDAAAAASILNRYGIEGPALEALASAVADPLAADDVRLGKAEFRMIAQPSMMLKKAADDLQRAGYLPILLGDDLEGEARNVAVEHAGLARHYAKQGGRIAILSGGELTVTIAGTGRGGPSREFALALAIALDGDPRFAAIACDSDGADGAADSQGRDVAGAVVDFTILERCRNMGMDPGAHLEDNDAGGLFERLGDGVVTGATQTNVNDFRCILVD